MHARSMRKESNHRKCNIVVSHTCSERKKKTTRIEHGTRNVRAQHDVRWRNTMKKNRRKNQTQNRHRGKFKWRVEQELTAITFKQQQCCVSENRFFFFLLFLQAFFFDHSNFARFFFTSSDWSAYLLIVASCIPCGRINVIDVKA